MMQTIISYFTSAIGELIDIIITCFLSAFNLSLSSMVTTFPFLVIGYRLFRSIGLGLVICIALWQLIKFFGGQIAEVRDTPIRILVRSFIAAAMIWFGGYFLEWVVDIAKIPFDVFTRSKAINFSASSLVSTISSMNLFGTASLDALGYALSPATLILAALIIEILIGWNILKLLLEVCERYLMIAVLVYSSPLIFPTISSQATNQIFKRWLSMFFGQCAIMTISAWMLKLICSGFSINGQDNVFFRLMLTLAMCKIAQRTDSYMQQLGIGVATTGGNLLDEAIGVASMMSRSRGGGGKGSDTSSKSSVLGAGSDGSLSRVGGLVGGVSNMVKKGIRDFGSGQSAAAIAGNLGKNFRQGMGIGDSLNGWKDMNTDQRKAAVAKANKGFRTGGVVKNAFDKVAMQRAQTLGAAGVTKSAAEANKNFASRAGANPEKYGQTGAKYANPKGTGHGDIPTAKGWNQDIQKEQQAAGLGAQQYMQYQRDVNGVGSVKKGQDGLTELDGQALKTGKSWENNSAEVRDSQISADAKFTDEQAQAFNNEFAAKNPDLQAYEGETITPEQAAMYNKRYGKDALSTQGKFDDVSANAYNEVFAPGLQQGDKFTAQQAKEYNALNPEKRVRSGHVATAGEAARYREAYGSVRAGEKFTGSQADAFNNTVQPKQRVKPNDTISAEQAKAYAAAIPQQERVKAGDNITKGQEAIYNETLAGSTNTIEGDSADVGAFMAQHYDGARADRDLQDAMIETARQCPVAAESALFSPYTELQNNDELGDALIKSAIGEKEITGQEGGRFSNIHTNSNLESGGRQISADYTDSSGKTTHYEMYNNAALTGQDKMVSSGEQVKGSVFGSMRTVETTGSGESICVKTPMPDHRERHSSSGASTNQQGGSGTDAPPTPTPTSSSSPVTYEAPASSSPSQASSAAQKAETPVSASNSTPRAAATSQATYREPQSDVIQQPSYQPVVSAVSVGEATETVQPDVIPQASYQPIAAVPVGEAEEPAQPVIVPDRAPEHYADLYEPAYPEATVSSRAMPEAEPQRVSYTSQEPEPRVVAREPAGDDKHIERTEQAPVHEQQNSQFSNIGRAQQDMTPPASAHAEHSHSESSGTAGQQSSRDPIPDNPSPAGKNQEQLGSNTRTATSNNLHGSTNAAQGVSRPTAIPAKQTPEPKTGGRGNGLFGRRKK